jgi:hypothetical protein
MNPLGAACLRSTLTVAGSSPWEGGALRHYTWVCLSDSIHANATPSYVLCNCGQGVAFLELQELPPPARCQGCSQEGVAFLACRPTPQDDAGLSVDSSPHPAILRPPAGAMNCARKNTTLNNTIHGYQY